MIRKWIKRLKEMKDIYKLILFIIALFGTNAFQYLFNGQPEVGTGEVITEKVATFVAVAKVAKVAKVAAVAAVAEVAAVSSCTAAVTEHVKEHHGGE